MKLFALALSLACFFTTAAAAPPGRFAAVPEITAPTHPETEPSRRLYAVTMNQARYLRGLLQPWDEHPEILALAWESVEHGVRPNAHTACGLALLARFGDFDEAVVGAPREQIEREAIALLRRVSSTHVTGPYTCSDGKHWGNQWQSALWAADAGTGAWLLWERLDDDLREAVGKVIEHEADRFVGVVPPAGVEIDTKAEENAWNAQVIALAAQMFPRHPHHEAWLETARIWNFSSYLRAEDLERGAPARWSVPSASIAGPTLHSDWTLENHGRVHPDYMSTPSILNIQMFYHAWSGRPLPRELLTRNQAGIAAILKYLSLPCGNFYYPNGQDWRLHREPDWLYDWALLKYLTDDAEAARLELVCLDTAEKMQARSDEGCVYLPGEWFFASAQHMFFERMALTWLAHRMWGPGPEPVPAAELDRRYAGLRHFEAGRFLCLRTPRMMASFSWGAVVMGEIALWDEDFLTSPEENGFIGDIVEAGAKPARPAVVAAAIDTGATPCVRLSLDRAGGKVRQELAFFLIEPDTVVYLERITAATDVQLDRCDTGVLGIVNQPRGAYERGYRMFDFAGGPMRVESVGRADTRRALAGNWLNVDGRLRVDFDGAGEPFLVDRAAPRRGRITETIATNSVPGGRYAAGQVVSRLGMVVRAECDDTGPASLAVDETGDGNVELTWQGNTYRLRP